MFYFRRLTKQIHNHEFKIIPYYRIIKIDTGIGVDITVDERRGLYGADDDTINLFYELKLMGD